MLMCRLFGKLMLVMNRVVVSIYDALVLYDKIKSYVKSVKNIKLDDKDPGEISFQNILKYQKNSVTLSWESLIKEKLF